MSDSEKHEPEEGDQHPRGDPFRTVASGGDAGSDAPDECPQQIGRYRIERLIGVGSFGRIYLAHDPQLQRSVAIKAPHAHLIARVEDAEPYLREAQTLARLDHPNIVPIYDVGSSEAIPFFIVSKYVEGTDLATRMRKKQLSFGHTAQLVATVAEALHYAHTQGFVHRDIKPANILLERDEDPCLADFGLALRDEDVGKGPRYAGTPAYMSPEQARGEGHRVDGRSDIYSLGAVLYELLVGRRTFATASQAELLELTAQHDPKPPRQIDDRVPRELERICLKAVARRASERYTTARDLAGDLQSFLAEHPTLAAETNAVSSSVPIDPSQQSSQRRESTAADSHPLRVVPKGLRAFDAGDADFFLELLPGPRDRRGLPDLIRFWKSKTEQLDADLTFPVGLIYGPSGCGKSSLVRAGLLPHLSEGVAVVYVESTAASTELRLAADLRKKIPNLPADGSLSELVGKLRREPELTHSRKTLIVLDQFEQWLHATEDYENSSLAQALRQCDGSHVQVLLMVRDDFWMAVTRLMQALEVRLVDGENSSTVDLFPPRHARKVLAAFGRAFGDLPEEDAPLTPSQISFLSAAISQLAENGYVICVRLALFAEMMKGKLWEPQTLQQTGGAEGLGVAFLEETFASPSAPLEHRYHQMAARRVLASLLPEPGTGIKGHLRSVNQLQAASGYEARPTDFASLLQILDAQLRLITPTDPTSSELERQSERRLAESDAADRLPGYYQLTHDYLIRPLREWLTRKARETRRGRASLRLAERSAQWHRQTQNRFLPSLWEHTSIRILTRRREWTDRERKMMCRAGAVHGTRAALLALLVLVAGWIGYEWYGSMRAQSIAGQIATAQVDDVLTLTNDIQRYRRWAEGPLRKLTQSDDPEIRWRAQVALLPSDTQLVDTQLVDQVKSEMLAARPDEVDTLRRALAPHAAIISEELWRVVERPNERDESSFLPAASALALCEPTSPRWEGVVDDVATALVRENTLHAHTWIEALRPIRKRLLGSLEKVYRNRDESYTIPQRDLATDILKVYADDEFGTLSELVVDGEPDQFSKLIEKLLQFDAIAIDWLRQELAREQDYSWNDAPLDPSWNEVSSQDAEAIETAQGLLQERYAFCQEMPLERFRPLLESLRTSGYRPVHVRPYQREGEVLVAATWARDQSNWQVAMNLSAEDLLARDEQEYGNGNRACDVAGYVVRDGESLLNRYCGIWVTQVPSDDRTRLFIKGTVTDFDKASHVIDTLGFDLPVSLQAFQNSDGKQEFCGVRCDGNFWTKIRGDRSPREYQNTEYLSLTQIDLSISSAELPTPAEQLHASRLAQAENVLLESPDNQKALEQRAEALFWTGEYERAIGDFSTLLKDGRPQADWLQRRAIASAQLGKADEARADLERFKQLGSDAIDTMLLETVMEAALDDEQRAIDKLEAFLKNNPSSGKAVHYAAQAYCMVSDALAESNKELADKFATRGVELMEITSRFVSNGYYFFQTQPELAAIRKMPRFQQIIAKGQLDTRYSGLWRTSRTHSSTQSYGKTPPEHLRAVRSFVESDYRPVTMTAAYMPDAKRSLTASIWHRPIVTEIDAFARRQANAALALLRFGEPEGVWMLLQHSTNPGLRSHFVTRCSQAGVDPEILAERLSVEENITARRAIVLCLAGYSSLSTSLQDRIARQLSDEYSTTNDPGLHSAIEHYFDKRGGELAIDGSEGPPAEGDRTWFYTELGQKMVVVPGPVEFHIGSFCRGHKWTTLPGRHMRRIPRTFAMGAREITVDQFQTFLREVPDYKHFYAKTYSPERSCPQGSVSWYDAAAYCRWLSQKEGIPEDQMCYPPISQIKHGMTLPAYREKRTGYRLPTETEWEFACKAGTTTDRFFGHSDQLLVRYAWCTENSLGRTWPVGSLMPNDLGLFDTLGNVAEWCNEESESYELGIRDYIETDLTDSEWKVLDTTEMITRGGDMSTSPRAMGSPVRNAALARAHDYGIGFRLARTMPEE